MTNRTGRRSLLALGISVLMGLSGCADKPVAALYESASALPGNAKLREADQVVCISINGAKLARENWLGASDGSTKLFTIYAGQCDIEVAFGDAKRHALQGGWTSETKKVSFTAEPDRTYRFESNSKIIITTFQGYHYHKDQWDVKVIDEQSKKVVAETLDMSR